MGTQTGTLIGIYPKLTLQFRKLNKNELEYLTSILDSARQTTTYYDPYLHRSNTITTYTGDYEITDKYIINGNNRKKVNIAKKLNRIIYFEKICF